MKGSCAARVACNTSSFQGSMKFKFCANYILIERPVTEKRNSCFLDYGDLVKYIVRSLVIVRFEIVS